MKMKLRDFMETNHTPKFTVAVVDDHGNFAKEESSIWDSVLIGDDLKRYNENIRKNLNKTLQWIGVKDDVLTLIVYQNE